MAKYSEILKRWNFPYIQVGGVYLIARQDAVSCIERIYAGPFRFYGWDAFTLSKEGPQPYLEWSASYEASRRPTRDIIIATLNSIPNEITHFEFVFDDCEQ